MHVVGGSSCRCDPPFCKAPVQAVCVPVTPDFTVATSIKTALSSSVTVGGDRAVFGILQIVTPDSPKFLCVFLHGGKMPR